jgi:hypothetical protein
MLLLLKDLRQGTVPASSFWHRRNLRQAVGEAALVQTPKRTYSRELAFF